VRWNSGILVRFTYWFGWLLTEPEGFEQCHIVFLLCSGDCGEQAFTGFFESMDQEDR
jgi:hypothetical protein